MLGWCVVSCGKGGNLNDCKANRWKRQSALEQVDQSNTEVQHLIVFVLRMEEGLVYHPGVDSLRVTRRLIHLCAQHLERGLLQHATEAAPEPRAAEAHPYSKRRSGDMSLHNMLVRRFMVRGGGFVSLTAEENLHELGIVDKASKLASNVASEFAISYLVKASGVIREKLMELEAGDHKQTTK